MSLPLAFGTTLETIPPIQPIILDAEKIIQWQSHLGTKNKPRVGLVWSGGTTHKDDRRRSIQLKDYLRHCTDDFDYFSLQKEVRENDTQDLQNSFIRHFSDDLHDFADTAALISQMDLVISVDTSVAHLAASLGKPTLILIPYAPDWRWMLDRDDSPWYPTVKLCRQTTLGDWQPTLQNLFKDLVDIKPMLLNNMLLS
jgi:ADP-heptose:LPS heptosyltransferase